MKSMHSLSPTDRLQLLRFVCFFAWIDGVMHPQERSLIVRLANGFGLSRQELRVVKGWVKSPPRPEDIEHQRIPIEHRQLFLSAVQAMIAVDDNIDPRESQAAKRLERMLMA